MSTCFGMVNQNSCASLTFGIRKMVLHYGMWDQIRTDQGKEWNLMLFVNDSLSHLRNDCSRPPHLQSSSKQVLHTKCHI